MPSFHELSCIQTTQGIVGDLAISPDGKQVLAIHGGFRSANWKPVYTASFATTEASVAPAFGRPAYISDDGVAMAIEAELKLITARVFDRREVRAEHDLWRGDPTLENGARLDAERVVIELTDRDDGHGYETPRYSTHHRTIDLSTGSSATSDSGIARYYRGPASPLATPNQRGPFKEPKLPFRSEWPVLLGTKRFLTDKRVFDAATAAVVHELARGSTFEDLSLDEKDALVVTQSGELQLWEVGGAEPLARIFRIDDGFQSARFIGATNEIVAGTTKGAVIRYALVG